MNDYMRTRSWLPWVLIAVVSVGVGMLAFNAGLARGLAANPAMVPGVVGWQPFWFHPYGFHPFGFVFPLFFLFFWFAVAKFLFWGGPWRRRWHDPTFAGVPPRFEEWHRRMHERMGKGGPSDQTLL